ncbi:MAG: hypothetical protein HKN67_11960, partial [Saprospiraceae bacterium]|nr:hypothetical protein [Saprospiraceae bacterium]
MKKQISSWLLLAMLAASILFLGQLERSSFPLLFTFYSIAFGAYILILNQSKSVFSLKIWIVIGITLRALTLFALPNLSDDLYRFIWDGWLITEGINPFAYRPTEILHGAIPGLTADPELFDRLNSQPYYSIYPALSQYFFAASYLLDFTHSWLGFSTILKLMFIGFEAASFFFIISILKAFGQNHERLLIYLLNPLIIIELCGNLHFECLMICCFLGTVYF